MMCKDKLISHGNEKKNRKRHCEVMETKKEKVKTENQLKGGNVLRRV